MNPTRKCVAYYSHPLFSDSRKNHNWYDAALSQLYFGYRRQKGYKSLEIYPNIQCSDCGQHYFNTQTVAFRKKCCKPIKQGLMKPLEPLTPLISEVLLQDYQHMGKCANYYNNSLCICSTGVANGTGKGGFEHDYRGNHAVTIRGRTYHTLMEQNSDVPTSALGYIFFDELIKPSSVVGDVMSEDYLQRFYTDLIQYNRLASEIYCIGQRYKAYNRSILFNGNHMSNQLLYDFVLNVNDNSSFFDIGLLRMDSVNERVIRFLNKDNKSTTIPVYSCKRQPLAYPLLFPTGELGWGMDNDDIIRKSIRMPEYVICRLLHLENIHLPCLLDNNEYIQTNRFEAMSRLTQVMVVDDVSTMVDTHLKFTENNQDIITAGSRADVHEEDVGKYVLHRILL